MVLKQNGIIRKEFNVLDIANSKSNDVKIEINQHPNGKLNLPLMPKIAAIEILKFKGYL